MHWRIGTYASAAVIGTIAVAAYSHGLGGADIAKWTIGAAVVMGLIVGSGVVEERVMPTADPLLQVGFGSSLVAVAMLAAYGVYGLAFSDGRGVAFGFGGAVAFALFAALLRAQYRQRGD